MHETSDFFYSIIFLYTKYFVQSYTVDVAFTLSYQIENSTGSTDSYTGNNWMLHLGRVQIVRISM